MAYAQITVGAGVIKTYLCNECGKKFQRDASQVHDHHVFCSASCSRAFHAIGSNVARAWKIFSRIESDYWNIPSEKEKFYAISPKKRSCYVKEARAMLEGKNWRGKNRCVKLLGDEVPA